MRLQNNVIWVELDNKDHAICTCGGDLRTYTDILRNTL